MRSWRACCGLLIAAGLALGSGGSARAGTNLLTVYGHVFIGHEQLLPAVGYSVEVSISHADGSYDDLTYPFTGSEQGRFAVTFVHFADSTSVADANDWATAIIRNASGGMVGTLQELIPAAAVDARLWHWELSTGASAAKPGTWGGIKALWR